MTNLEALEILIRAANAKFSPTNDPDGARDRERRAVQEAAAQLQLTVQNTPLERPDRENVKDAWMWVYACHPYTIGFPGVNADLFFSSPENFHQLLGRKLSQYETLLKVQVPADFEDWDYIPENY